MNQIDASAVGRPRRALLAWEFGTGRTHAGNLLGVAGHLRRAGVECLAALYDLRFANEFAALGIPVVQTYVWPARRRAPFGWQERNIRGLGDVLANLGVADPPSLGAALAHYDGLSALFNPDIVIAENAFGAIFSARGRRPAIAFGTGSCLPPLQGAGFALRLGGEGPPSWPDEHVREGLNKGLAAAGRPPLGVLSDLLRIEGVYPFGPREFDIHGPKRVDPMLPAYVPDIDRPIKVGEGEEIFVYLHGFVQDNPEIMAGLRAIDRPMRLYVPGLAADQRAGFPPSCRFEQQAVPVPEILKRSRAVIHHGGPQLTTLCLAAGLPQVILAKELDNELCARFVLERGVGAARFVTNAKADWLTSVGRRAYDDVEVKGRCAAAAPEFAAWLSSDPTRTVADAALSLIGGPERAAAKSMS